VIGLVVRISDWPPMLPSNILPTCAGLVNPDPVTLGPTERSPGE
jgi:hypothetical protein